MNALLKPREEFLANRRRGIGGSDVAAILGLSPWRTALDVYHDKRGESPEQPDNEAMAWGRALEPVIRQEYANRTGRQILVPEHQVVHPEHDFMIANLDGITTDDRVFEAKTARAGTGWGEPGTDQVPQPYLLQVQHYLAVMRYDVADIAVLIGGSDFRIYEVPADPELQAMMIEAEAEFWQRVLAGNPPDPVSYADALQRYGQI
ncbi:MAG: YqaJ viral recombinase family protein, partial [Arenimonas sp.]